MARLHLKGRFFTGAYSDSLDGGSYYMSVTDADVADTGLGCGN